MGDGGAASKPQEIREKDRKGSKLDFKNKSIRHPGVSFNGFKCLVFFSTATVSEF